MDSSMARPISSVRLTVEASSGCCAMAVSACTIAFVSPIAGAMDPKTMHKTAMTIDASPMIVTLSISFLSFLSFLCGWSSRLALLIASAMHRGGDVHHAENGKDVRLDDTGEQRQHLHGNGKDKWRDSEQHGAHQGLAHDIAE